MAEAEGVVEVIKYPKTPHLPFSAGRIGRCIIRQIYCDFHLGVQTDDIVLKSEHAHSLKFLAHKAVLTEKLDGGNCSIYRGKVCIQY